MGSRVDLVKLFGIKGAALLLVIIITAFLVLNYFNILSLSTLYPNLFGFMPNRNLQTLLNEDNAGAIFIGCPIAQDLCYGGRKVEVQTEGAIGTTSWLAFNLPAQVPILAVFNGGVKREIIPLPGDFSFNLVTLKSLNGKYQAQYLFISKTVAKGDKKQVIDGGTAKKGESIGLTEGYPLAKEENAPSLHFNISIVDSGTPLEIPPDNIENVVLP
ncbi:MAG: hypothetical protein HYU48_00560 [Candidatus Levybacteria bacterium]|nr:hypothetical protein [Candidatus Levybacteria bacterium]